MAENTPSKTAGDYCIIVTEAYEGLMGWREKYHSGSLFFKQPDGKLYRTEVGRHTLKFRKKHFTVPDDPVKDEAAKAAEYKRYLPAMKLHEEFLKRTGQRYELLREADRTLPYLPRLP